jgi:hypothetical protein
MFYCFPTTNHRSDRDAYRSVEGNKSPHSWPAGATQERKGKITKGSSCRTWAGSGASRPCRVHKSEESFFRLTWVRGILGTQCRVSGQAVYSIYDTKLFETLKCRWIYSMVHSPRSPRVQIRLHCLGVISGGPMTWFERCQCSFFFTVLPWASSVLRNSIFSQGPW